MPNTLKGSQETSSHIVYPQDGVALCLSGGGYRAMLFHVGTLWRLFEAGKLSELQRISSVSGGSITAGVLAKNWDALSKSTDIQVLKQSLVTPIRQLASTTIDWKSVVLGFLLPGGAGKQIERSYRKYLYQETSLQDLPDHPRFVINSTNIQSGALWRFQKPYMRDYRVGEIKNPDIPLATAVAASSSFPPVLSPFKLNLKESDFTPKSGLDLQYPPYTTRVMLSDGGVYDNLGLETVYKSYRTLLVSDGGAKIKAEPKPSTIWPLHAYRVLNLIDNQVGSLRKRELIKSYQDADSDNHREGAYWGIRANIDNYELSETLPCPYEDTQKLADIKTRLKAMPNEQQEMLINWGYAVCDAALRKYVDPHLIPAKDFPYPDVGVG